MISASKRFKTINADCCVVRAAAVGGSAVVVVVGGGVRSFVDISTQDKRFMSSDVFFLKFELFSIL